MNFNDAYYCDYEVHEHINSMIMFPCAGEETKHTARVCTLYLKALHVWQLEKIKCEIIFKGICSTPFLNEASKDISITAPDTNGV